MRFEVLGPMRTSQAGAETPVSGRLRRGLLAMLLAHPNEPVTADTLVEAIWQGRPVERGAQRLHLLVHKLRRTLDDPSRLTHDAGGYRLRVAPDELDAARFAALLDDADAARDDPDRCAALIRTALELWRGTPYDGVDLLDLEAEVERLEERRRVALEELYAAEMRRGRHGAVIGELTELVRRHPLRERLHGLLISALYRDGRQGDALAAYRNARDIIVREFGIEPGPELRALEERILAGEPLEPVTPAVPATPAATPAGARVVPAQLPHTVSGFIGREDELAWLDGLLAAGGDAVPISAVAGTAGVGKTALAVRWAHRVKERFPDGQLYVDLRGYGPGEPAAPGDVLDTFLRALGQDGAAIPGTLTERAARFRTLADGKRLLVVLDNARDAGQVRDLLPGAPACFVIVTSRDSLTGLAAREGAHRVDLDRMSTEEARRLLDPLLDSRADDDAVGRLIGCCANLPLALRVAAERVRERRHTPLDDIVTELAGERDRLDLFDGDDPQASVRAVFSWSYRHLDPSAARLFRLLGTHPGHDADTYAMAALLGTGDPRTARLSAQALVRAHLIEETGDGRYSQHDLLRAYAAELSAEVDPEAERRAAVDRVLAYYLRAAAHAADIVTPHEYEPDTDAEIAMPAPSTFEAAMRWLDTERPNLVSAAEAAVTWDLPGYPGRFCAALFYYLDLGWFHDDARRMWTAALESGEADPYGAGAALRLRGIVRHRVDRFADAGADYHRALELHDAAGAERLRAGTLNLLGSLHRFFGDTDEARRCLRESVDCYGRTGHHVLAQRPLVSLGLLYQKQGAYEDALGCFHRALDLARDGLNLSVHAHVAYCVAGVHRDLGEYDDALRYGHQALSLARAARYGFLDGLIRNRLGTICTPLGRHDDARGHHREAARIAREIGNTKLESIALNDLGAAHIAAGEPEAAIGCRADALDVVTRRGSPYEQARAHAGLGDAHAHLGHHDQAAEHWAQALRIYRSARSPRAEEIAERLRTVDS